MSKPVGPSYAEALGIWPHGADISEPEKPEVPEPAELDCRDLLREIMITDKQARVERDSLIELSQLGLVSVTSLPAIDRLPRLLAQYRKDCDE